MHMPWALGKDAGTLVASDLDIHHVNPTGLAIEFEVYKLIPNCSIQFFTSAAT